MTTGARDTVMRERRMGIRDTIIAIRDMTMEVRAAMVMDTRVMDMITENGVNVAVSHPRTTESCFTQYSLA